MKKETKAPLSFAEAEEQHMYPDYYYSGIRSNPNARAGLKTIHEALLNPVKDAHTGTVITAPCGMGKTTVMIAKATESALAGSQRWVMATDRVKRLSETLEDAIEAGKAVSNRDPILNISDGDKVKLGELWSAPYKQVVGVTPQRIVNMDDPVLAPIYQDGIKTKQTGVRSYKDIFLCDEAIVDTEIDNYTLSQLYAVVGHLRESISPDNEDDIDDGQAAKKAGDLAELLLDLVRKDIDRINAGNMTYGDKESKNDRTRVDVFMGYLDILNQFESRLGSIADSLTGIVQILRDKGRIKSDSTRKSKIEKLADNVEKIKNMTRYSEIQTWCKDISVYLGSETCKKYIPTDVIDGLAARISDFAETAKIKTAPDEIRRSVEKNKKNIRENSEGCENIIPVDSFLSIFSQKNVVTMRTIRRGRSKIDNRPQVEITVAQYTLDRLPWGRMPIVIMDGTGDLNPAYTDGRYKFEIVSNFHRPRIPMHIIQYGEVSGSYDLTKDGRAKAKRLFDNLKTVLDENYERIDPSQTVLTCQKDIADIACRYAPGRISDKDVATYMSPQLTGSNDYKDRKVIIKIGASTISQYVSLLQIYCRRPDIWHDIVDMPETERQQLMRAVYNYNANPDNCQYYTQIRDNQVRTAMVSIVQEFQRLRCRNYPTSDDPAELRKYAICVMWIIRGREQGIYPTDKESLSEEIVRRTIERFGGKGTVRYTYHAPVLDAYKSDSMVPAMVRDWYMTTPAGVEYSYSIIAQDINATEAAVRQAISRDNELRAWMDGDEIISQRPMTRRKIAKNVEKQEEAKKENAVGALIRAYQALRYGDSYSYQELADKVGLGSVEVERVMRYNSVMKALSQYDATAPDGRIICQNPAEDIKSISVWHRERGAYDSYTADDCRRELGMDVDRFWNAWNSGTIQKVLDKGVSMNDGRWVKRDRVADEAAAERKREEAEKKAKKRIQEQQETVMNWYIALPYGAKYSASIIAKECKVPAAVAAEALKSPGMMALRVHDTEVKQGVWSREMDQLVLHLE